MNSVTLATFVGCLCPACAGATQRLKGEKPLAARADAIITARLRPDLFAERGLVSVGRTVLVALLTVLVLVGFGFRVSGLGVEGLSEDELNKLQAVADYREHGLTSANSEHPLLMKALLDTLENDGHFVTSADGGQEGINAFEAAHQSREPFSVVITDLGMPYVDGRKVSAAVKTLSPKTPVILFTGWGQRLLAERDIPQHVDRVLNKPPKLHDLRAALTELTATNRGRE